MATNKTPLSAMAAASREIQNSKMNGLQPLAGGTSGLHLEMAHAQLRFFAFAMQDREAINSKPGGSSNIDDLNGEQISLALDGIAFLIAMHAFHRDAETGEE